VNVAFGGAARHQPGAADRFAALGDQALPRLQALDQRTVALS
jgi:hypothetical protein